MSARCAAANACLARACSGLGTKTGAKSNTYGHVGVEPTRASAIPVMRFLAGGGNQVPRHMLAPDNGRETTVIRAIDRIRAQAYLLARSGSHRDCDAVERRLFDEGYQNAYQALLDPYVRQHVTRLCQQRQRAPGKRTAALHIASIYLEG